MGSASRSLSGNQAKKVVFNGSPSEYFGPQSAKPGLFSAGEPASAFEGTSGVVAGTVPRRWNGNGGGRRWGPGSRVAGPVSSAKVFGPVSGYVEFDSGNTQFCGAFVAPVPSGTETVPNGAQVHDAAASPGAIETDLENAQFDGAETELGFSVSESDAPVEDIFNGSMNTFSGDASESVDVGQPAHSVAGQTRGFAGSGTVRRRRTSSRRGAGGRACAGQAVPLVGAGSARAVHSAQRAGAEAGSDSLANFVASFHTCENHAIRTGRVTAILHAQRSHNSQIHNSYSTPTRSLHDVHVARCVHNSMNSLGDRVVRERGFCVPGGTKSLSTCTRTRVRRPAVEKLASPQQASLKLHEEMWAGLPKNLGPRIFREVEIVPGCAVRVACPSCPDYYPEPPGPGIVIRNMLGWSQLEKTERSGVWLFRGALQGENLFSLLDAAGDWERKGSYHTAWAVPCNSSCSCSYAYGHGPAIGPHTGERCWPLLAGVWRAIAPLMKPWCAEGDLPTAANLNLYRGWKSCVGWHCDDEPLFGKCGDAKLIVSVSLGNFALFRWRRQSCLSNENSSCRLDHGDILVMDGQCQDEFLHRTSPGREQDRINITFRWVKQHVASCPLFKAGVACCLPTCAQGSSVPVMGNDY